MVEFQTAQNRRITIENAMKQSRIGNDLAKIHVVIKNLSARLMKGSKQKANIVVEVQHQISQL